MMELLDLLLDILFGCTHPKLTFPITSRPGQRRSEAAAVTGTYVTCLDCGKELPYDWNQMKVISARSYSQQPTELELDSILMRRPNGGVE